MSRITGIAKTARKTAKGLNRWNTGCAFVDYDNDGHLDLFVANYIDFDPKTVPLPEIGQLSVQGHAVACGPPGSGRRQESSCFTTTATARSPMFPRNRASSKPAAPMAWVCWSADFDNDGWPDIYVANDSTSSALYKNNHDGTFTDIAIEAGCAYSADGKATGGYGRIGGRLRLRRATSIS